MVQTKSYSLLAFISLILGIVSIFLIASPGLRSFTDLIFSILTIIFGIIALVEIKKINKKGKGLAITGLILGIISLIFNAIMLLTPVY